MSQIEFEVTTDLAPIINTQITTNFEAVKEWLSSELAPYASMVVTPDAIPGAKKTRAEIRKVGESIDSQRKAVKKMWLKPYEEYEAQCKQLTNIVGDAVANIDGQIKAMEAEEKAQKKQRLSDLFDDNSYDVADYITFEDIFDPKWLNATFSEIDAANSIVKAIENVKDSLNVIRTMESPYEAAMLSEFSKTQSLAKALAEGKRLEAIQKAEEERKAREAMEAFEEQEKPADEPVEEPTATPATTAQFIKPVADEPPKPKLYTLRFEVTGTAEAFGALKRCMVANHLEYKKI